MLNLLFIARTFLAGVVLMGASVVYSQDYPNKPVHIVTGSAGGGSDFAARQLAQGISGPLGQPVIVDNRPAIVAAETVSKAPPDGYTLLVNGAIIWLLPLLQKVPYDVADYLPIALITREVSVLVVHPSVPVKSVKELIALAKARPGELNYSAGGIGTPSHLSAELFKSMAGLNIVHVPYKGIVAALTPLISGEVQIMFNDAGAVVPHVNSGRLRPLAVTSAQPSALAPGLPTVAASGLPGYESVSMTGIWGPARIPGVIVIRLNQEIVRVLNRAEVRERFLGAGADTVGSTPEEFAGIIKSEIAKMGKVIKDAGIKAD